MTRHLFMERNMSEIIVVVLTVLLVGLMWIQIGVWVTGYPWRWLSRRQRAHILSDLTVLVATGMDWTEAYKLYKRDVGPMYLWDEPSPIAVLSNAHVARETGRFAAEFPGESNPWTTK